MIKRSAIVYFVLFVIVMVAAFYLQRNEDKATPPSDGGFEPVVLDTPDAVATPGYLFSARDGNVTSIFIESKDGKSVGLERLDGVWRVTKPEPGEAIQSSVEEAASQILALQYLDSLDLPNADVGLDAPSYTITVGFSSGNFVIALVGDETPTGNGYYVRKETGPALVVGKYGLLALINMLDFPPYVASPTPAASETPAETATPTLAPTNTPDPAAETPVPTATNAP
jgi:hypothetical protein